MKIIFYLFVFTISYGNYVYAQKQNLPTVHIALGMSQSDVKLKSTYPINFSNIYNGNILIDASTIVTASVNFNIASPHKLTFNNIRYSGIVCNENGVKNFSGDTPLMNVDNVFSTITKWHKKILKSGWKELDNPRKVIYAPYPHNKAYKNLDSLKNDFLVKGKNKINRAQVGEWLSNDGRQVLILSLVHKRLDGGPRYTYSPAPLKPLIEATYLLRFYIKEKT